MTALPRVPDQAEIDEFFARQSATEAKANEYIVFSPEDRQLIADIQASVRTGLTIAADQRKREEILARFERKTLTDSALRGIENSTEKFRAFAELILDNTKPGREQSAALTALEEAKFWTNQSLALNGELASSEGEEAQAEAIQEGLKRVPRGSTFSLTDEAAELLKQSDARREQAAK